MRKFRVLLVDDEELFRTTICSCFPWGQHGFEVCGQTSNGKEALEFLNREKADMVLCDVQMPVMTGVELAEALYGRKDAPVMVFFSGYQEFEYARMALKYGVKDYIVKPVQFDVLAGTLEQMRKLLEQQCGEEKEEFENNEAFVRTIQDYVLQNLQKASLSEIADILYMNQSYVSQLYKQKTGENFSDYLLKMRMKKAGELLKNPGLHIYEVGRQVGYSNPNNFTRTFRNYYGMTPKAYQDRQMYLAYHQK